MAGIIVLNERAYPKSASRRERETIDCERAEQSARDNLDYLLSKGAYIAVQQILEDYRK